MSAVDILPAEPTAALFAELMRLTAHMTARFPNNAVNNSDGGSFNISSIQAYSTRSGYILVSCLIYGIAILLISISCHNEQGYGDLRRPSRQLRPGATHGETNLGHKSCEANILAP